MEDIDVCTQVVSQGKGRAGSQATCGSTATHRMLMTDRATVALGRCEAHHAALSEALDRHELWEQDEEDDGTPHYRARPMSTPPPASLQPEAPGEEVVRTTDLLPAPAERQRIRAEAGLTQVALAERLGVSSSALSRWESGQRLPEGGDLANYAQALEALAGRGDA